MSACPFDPADKWDEDDGYEYDDTQPAADLDEDQGFVGVGLVISETGELAIVHACGAMDEWDAFRVNDTEARGLAAMIDAILA